MRFCKIQNKNGVLRLVQQRGLFPNTFLRLLASDNVVKQQQQVRFVTLDEGSKVAHQPQFLAKRTGEVELGLLRFPRGQDFFYDPEHARSAPGFELSEILFQELGHRGIDGSGGELVGQHTLAGNLVNDDSHRGIRE